MKSLSKAVGSIVFSAGIIMSAVMGGNVGAHYTEGEKVQMFMWLTKFFPSHTNRTACIREKEIVKGSSVTLSFAQAIADYSHESLASIYKIISSWGYSALNASEPPDSTNFNELIEWFIDNRNNLDLVFDTKLTAWSKNFIKPLRKDRKFSKKELKFRREIRENIRFQGLSGKIYVRVSDTARRMNSNKALSLEEKKARLEKVIREETIRAIRDMEIDELIGLNAAIRYIQSNNRTAGYNPKNINTHPMILAMEMTMKKAGRLVNEILNR